MTRNGTRRDHGPVVAWYSNCKSPARMHDGPILVIEDNRDGRDLLRHVLESNGYRVETACDGVAGLAAARAAKPALILTDLMMPLMDGVEFRQLQLLDPSIADIPCFVVSAHYDAPQVARQIGADRWIRKPISFAHLLAQIASVLRR